MKQTIPIDDVIARTRMQLRLSDTSQDDFLEVLINEGLKHLDTLSLTTKKQKCICVEGGKAKLPCGFVRLLGIKYKATRYDGKPIDVTPVYIDKNFLRSCGVEEDALGIYDDFYNSFQINGDFIYFSSAGQFDEVEIAYLGYHTDDKDRLLVKEMYERALTAYACYNYAMAYIENYNQYAIEKYSAVWKAQKQWIRGKDAREDFENTKFQMGKIFNALLVNRELMTYNSDLW